MEGLLKWMGLFLEWCIEQAQWPQWGAGVGGGSAFGVRQWVPDEMHLDVSLKCGACGPWGHLSHPPRRQIVPHSLSLLFVQRLYAPQAMGLPRPPLGSRCALGLSVFLRRLPWSAAQGFLPVITSHPSLLYPSAWPWAILSLHRCAYTLARGEYLILGPFCHPWALLIPGWCCGKTLTSSSCSCSL